MFHNNMKNIYFMKLQFLVVKISFLSFEKHGKIIKLSNTPNEPLL